MVAHTHGSLLLMIATVYFGKLSGDFCLYRIGYKLGPRASESKHFGKLLRRDRVERVQRFFDKYGMGTILMVRFLPGLRAPTYLIAGITRFSGWKFVIADGIAALVSAPLLTWLGYRYGEGVLDRIEHSGRWAVIGFVALVAIAVGVKLLMRRRARSRAKAEATVDGRVEGPALPPAPPVHREA
jgi:membrane protein DedA with SNARE-associated domain